MCKARFPSPQPFKCDPFPGKIFAKKVLKQRLIHYGESLNRYRGREDLAVVSCLIRECDGWVHSYFFIYIYIFIYTVYISIGWDFGVEGGMWWGE